MSNFMGVGICWIGLNQADLGCWRLTLMASIEVGNRSSFDGSTLNICASSFRGALPYKPTRDVPFFRVSFFSINS